MFLVFDIGGTTTRMAISYAGNSLEEVKLFPTNHNFSEAMEQMNSVAMELSSGEKYHAVVGGVRAYDKKRGTLFHQPNYPMWVDEPLLQKMQEMWGTVYLENDAALDGLGEAVYGAGKGSTIVGYITLSTGIGGTRIVNGKLEDTEYGFEPGNMLMPSIGDDIKSFEQIVSGSAIESKYGKNPFELEEPNAWEEITENVAMGLSNVIVMWSPDVVVLGGSVPQKMDFEKLNNLVSKYCKIYPVLPVIKKDTLEEEGGLYGALAYIQKLP